jgi:hypothetical protein
MQSTTQLATLTAALFLSAAACAQTPTPTDAPIPFQIAQSKSAFLSNTCDLEYEDCRVAYNTMYQALTTWGHYTLVTKPEDAELVLQVHLSVYDYVSHLQLSILDEHSHFTLWNINEWIDPNDSHSAATFQAAANRVIKDLEVLAKPGATAGPTQLYPVPKLTKKRF